MRHFAPTELELDFEFVAFVEELFTSADFGQVVMLVDVDAKLEFLEFAGTLFLFLLLFRHFVAELAEVDDTTDGGDGIRSDLDEVELLQRQVQALKESRERLIEALDSANDEAAAAAADALSLGAALSRARAETAAWEAAAQEAVARADALADLLEDASKWSSGGSGVGVDGGGGSGVGASYTAAATGASSSPPPNNNNSLLAAERAARAAAEARVTALCVELGRARRSGDELAASVGPALAAVEAKLAAVRWPC